MPTYDYECSACGHTFEKFQSITAPAVRKCPKCGRRKVRRLIGTGAGVIFKGSGFYATDYRSDSYKKAAEKHKKTEGGRSEKSSAEAAGKTSGEGGGKPSSSNGDSGSGTGSRPRGGR